MNRLLQAFKNFQTVITRWFATRWFWRGTVALFVIQSAYVAFVGRYSMAFDEYYHLGTIQAYAKVWLPWSVQQPAGDAPIGAITADGSYLYHYLMSFPYRILTELTSSLTTQIIIVRLIDVAIVVVGLYIFRRLLIRLGISKGVAQLLLCLITLIPMTPFLSGQLTYDTLWFSMTAVSVLAMIKLVDTIRRSHTLPIKEAAVTLSLLLLTSQIKYAFLPMALGGGIFFVVYIWKQSSSGNLPFRQILKQWQRELKRPLAIGALGLLCISAVLFGARYGANIIKYHTPVPACNVVLSTERCNAYGPFARDENHRRLHFSDNLTVQKKLGYPFGWFHQMVRESYFAVGPKEVGYQTGDPLPIAYRVGYAVAILAGILLIVRAKYLWRYGARERLLVTITVTYTAFLFGNNYHAYLTTGVPVAIHGRYLLALLPLFGYLVYRAVGTLSWWKQRRSYAATLAVVILLATFYGGGVAPFVLRSNDGWYWPAARPLSNTVRSIASPVIWH